jgi:hypothetical protein
MASEATTLSIVLRLLKTGSNEAKRRYFRQAPSGRTQVVHLWPAGKRTSIGESEWYGPDGDLVLPAQASVTVATPTEASAKERPPPLKL